MRRVWAGLSPPCIFYVIRTGTVMKGRAQKQPQGCPFQVGGISERKGDSKGPLANRHGHGDPKGP